MHDFCTAVPEVLGKRIFGYPTLGKLEDMPEFFEDRWGLRQCKGAVDGFHIPMPLVITIMINTNGWHSVVYQAVVHGKGIVLGYVCWHTRQYP